MSVKKFHGKTLVDIREYYQEKEESKPGRKGILLSALLSILRVTIGGVNSRARRRYFVDRGAVGQLDEQSRSGRSGH